MALRFSRGMFCWLSVLVWAVVFGSSSPAQNRDDAVSNPTAGTVTAEPARFLNEVSSNAVVFPTTTKNRLGWRMVVRVASSLTADTMRVEMSFSTTGGPTTADLNLELRLTPSTTGHSPPQSSLRASVPFRIPEGTSQTRLARHLPKSSFGNFYVVEILEGGRPVPGCRSSVGDPITYRDSAMYVNQNLQMRFNALWVRSDVDDSTRPQSLKTWALSHGGYPYHSTASPDEWMQMIESGYGGDTSSNFAAVGLDTLPLDWRAYQPYDAVLMHGEDWRSLSEKSPAAATALRQWVQLGGVLILRGVNAEDVEALPAERYQTASRESLAEASIQVQQTAAHYDAMADPNSELYSREMSYIVSTTESRAQWDEWFPEAAKELRQSLRDYPTTLASQENGVQGRAEVAGTIIYLGTPEKAAPEKGSGTVSEERATEPGIETLQWAAALELMGWKHSRLIRSGADPILGSQRFFQWVIPGVSQPPVYTFMGLLGVFVVLVGPVAYRKTAKAGRSYLMFAIAPVLAIATTVALLGYGVVADGFGTRARIRQITWVDGATGEGGTRSRSTYFAGIRPSQGLTFPGDSEVTLYPDNQTRGWEARVDDRFESRGLVTATEDALVFNRDFLPSRQQRQFVVHRPVSRWGQVRIGENLSDEPLPVVLSPTAANSNNPANVALDEEKLTGPASVVVHCDANTPLREIIICDPERRYYFAEFVDAGASTIAVQITKKHASERLGEMYKRQWLISTVVQRRETNSAFNRSIENEMSDLVSERLNQIDSVVKPTDGVFEFELQQRLQLQSDLPPNSFLALADIDDDAVAIEGTQVTDSIHYVMGSLP
ncbi:hypothetical protein [Rhodopirellula sallentina]|uniref:Signal peptide protein n=1 Tax=Rhodopirellula sallentina SM41 TaxID=1263870 RepID=M5UGN3_9BACT|nr:hypothetical protein [Rhodopirellula sallentina]EMI55173.1 signal peptide protein [Rhodopirellula sallentina SM41]